MKIYNFFSKSNTVILCLCVGILSLTTFNSYAAEAKKHRLKERTHHEIDDLIELEVEVDEKREKENKKRAEEFNKLGKKLEKKFWEVVKKREHDTLQKIILPVFQGNGPSGTISRKHEIETLLASHIEDFSLEDVKTIISDNLLVITYKFTYTGTGLINGPTLSVWKQNKTKQWRLVSHSFSADLIEATP